MKSPIFFYSGQAEKVVRQLVKSLPEDVEVYLVGGAVRNAVIREVHGEVWRQRDYDMIVTRNSPKFYEFLAVNGFKKTVERPSQRVYVLPVVDDPRDENYEDNLVFDTHAVDGTTISDNLKHNTGLMVNGFALPLRDVFDENWRERLIELDGAWQSVKDRMMRVNLDGYTSQANYFFALLRFMGMGFLATPQEETLKLLSTVVDLEPNRYTRNVRKLVNYVGGEDRVREIVASLGVEGLDIFNEKSTKELAREVGN